MLSAQEIVAKVKADRTTCDIVARAGITVEKRPEAPPNRPGLKWIPHQATAGGPIAWIESEYDASMPGTRETPIAFETGLTVYPNYFYTLGGVTKVWTGDITVNPDWGDIWFAEI